MLHWSNTKETLRLLKEVIEPYLSKKKKELGLTDSQKALLIWDDSKVQSTEDVMEELETQGIKDVPCTKNITYLLRLLDM